MPESLLSVDELSVVFRTHDRAITAVDGVSFACERGKVLGLVGESGCGKSTTAMAIPGLLPAQAELRCAGISFAGERIDTQRGEQLRRLRGRHIGVIFQDPMSSLNPYLRISTQLCEHQRLHLGITKKDAERRSCALLERVGIDDPAEALRRHAHQFSGGQRQRIMIAIALACDPELLIADEPTTALDVTIQAETLDLIKQLQRERELAMLLISHDLGVIAGCSDEVCVMDAGRIVEHKPCGALFAEPEHAVTRQLLAAVPVIPEKATTGPTAEERNADPAQDASGKTKDSEGFK